MKSMSQKQIISSVLVLVAVALLYPIYNAPIWWVSLEAPNYPEEAFPDGVRILFHVNGVFNGCVKQAKTEITEDEALDCVHEMDTINHYVGMYPIASGGPVELFFSLFLVTLVAVMLVAFACVRPKIRMIIMLVGFSGLAIWMGMAYYGANGLKLHSERYLEGRITVLGETSEEMDAEEDTQQAESAGDALIARLRAALDEEPAEEEAAPAPAAEPEIKHGLPVLEKGKEKNIAYLKDAYLQYRADQDNSLADWTGSGSQVLAWHYQKSLGKYFRDPEVLKPMVAKIRTAGAVVFWGLIVIMIVLVVFARKPEGFWNWLLVLIPAGLPVFFAIEYAVWLWWYGHNMNDMGAFTLKAFMPTAFGQGKVAQFTTNSYPEYGFWLMVLFSALLLVSALLRRKPSENDDPDEI
ncbi:hypothetical protein CSB20_10395 [bacterium DOLZORAL124_64_63]|nr:MAG: hypothetical protein CSB20_10395 [bacterium DOLZORAL124_64_63]